MRIVIIIDYTDYNSIRILVGPKGDTTDITRYIFKRKQRDVLDVRKIPGEISRKVIEDEDRKKIIIKNRYSCVADYAKYKTKIKSLLVLDD